MVTVLRIRGFQRFIHAKDHDPAHVHVVGDGEVKINLLGAGSSLKLV